MNSLIVSVLGTLSRCSVAGEYYGVLGDDSSADSLTGDLRQCVNMQRLREEEKDTVALLCS